ncbi:MAG: ABC transporter ATP-binding protein, partial [Shimia sp.]
QRVALGRAIVREPAVFLMDEPLSNLDAKLRVTTRAQIKNLQARLGTTTIYVTHDQVEAMTMADRVVVMNAGRVLQVGTPTEIYDRPADTFVASFIGAPAMNLVPGDLSERGFTGPNITVEGLAGPPGKATLGFRAEDAALCSEGGALRGPLYSVEPLGDATLLSWRLGQALVSLKAPKGTSAKIGEVVGADIPASACHLFNTATGHRIEAAR